MRPKAFNEEMKGLETWLNKMTKKELIKYVIGLLMGQNSRRQ